MGVLDWIFRRNTPTNEHERVIQSLEDVIAENTKKVRVLYTKAQAFSEEAKLQFKQGNKTKAKLALKLKKKYEEVADNIDCQVTALSNQEMNVKCASVCNEVHGVLSMTANEWQGGKLNVDEVANLVQSAEELRETQILVNLQPEVDDDLEKELAALTLEDEAKFRTSENFRDKEKLDSPKYVHGGAVIASNPIYEKTPVKTLNSSRDNTVIHKKTAEEILDTPKDVHGGVLASNPIFDKTLKSSSENPLIHEKTAAVKKSYAYAEVVKKLNSSREQGLSFRPAVSFQVAYESLGVGLASGKSVKMQKLWQLIQAMTGEDLAIEEQGVSKRMSLITGAIRHLECFHQKVVLHTIQRDPIQAALGGSVGNFHRNRRDHHTQAAFGGSVGNLEKNPWFSSDSS